MRTRKQERASGRLSLGTDCLSISPARTVFHIPIVYLNALTASHPIIAQKKCVHPMKISVRFPGDRLPATNIHNHIDIPSYLPSDKNIREVITSKQNEHFAWHFTQQSGQQAAFASHCKKTLYPSWRFFCTGLAKVNKT